MIEPVAIPQELLNAIDTYAAVAEDDDKGAVARKVVIEKLRQFRAIPPGYALVPVEPTAAMNFAAYDECQRVSTVQVGLSTIAALYKAMLTAAKGE